MNIITRSQNLLFRLTNQLLKLMEQLVYRRYNNFPFGQSPHAVATKYMQIWQKERHKLYPLIDDFEARVGNRIDKRWLDDLALLTQIVIKESEICYQHGRLLYAVLMEYLENSNCHHPYVVETGTARGFSALCMAKALEDNNVCGQIMTFDILPHDVEMYWNCIADKDGPQSRRELLSKYRELIEKYVVFFQGDTTRELKKVSFSRVHFAFLDAAHTYEQVWSEFNCIRNLQQGGDIVFFDDYTPANFPGVVRAVDEICESYGYSKQVIPLTEGRGYAIARKDM